MRKMERVARLRGLAPASVTALALVGLLSACGTAESGGPDTGGGADTGVEDTGDVGTDGSGAGDSGVDDGGTPDGSDDVSGDGGPDGGTDGGPLPGDSDGDGILDEDEGSGDPDGDGLPNYADTDADGDGIPDSVEGGADVDDDGRPNNIDTDSDSDGIPDADEGGEDLDGDTLPNSADVDSDGDGMDDSVESTDDSDGDGTPNYQDTDSDGDNIADFFEGIRDADGDGVPNFLDEDSDDDGWSDSAEYGEIPGSGNAPTDRDRDRDPDYIDVDSDGDGLADADEIGCPDATDRELYDSDGDGVSDLIEIAFGEDAEDAGQACNPDEGIEDDVDFFFELPYLDPEQNDELEFATDVRRADIMFNMDTTGSMSGVINSLKSSLETLIIPAFDAALEDDAYGASQFDDFPCDGHGGYPSDQPLILRQRITSNVASATAGVRALTLHSGGDYYESGIESLYQLATGVGRTNRSCPSVTTPSGWIVDPFDPAFNLVPGVADGEIGGAGFREGSVPIVVHMTDAPSHAKGEVGDGFAPYAHGATRTETINALAGIGAKVIGVASGSAARTDLEGFSVASNSTVPACAWDGFRPFGCSAGQCCTGLNGAGRPPIGDVCPLVYDVSSGGTGLDNSIISGVQALINFASFDLTTRARGDEEELALSGIDTSCFIRDIRPLRWELPDAECVSEPDFADFNRDGTDDGFSDVTPGTALFFDVVAYNDCVVQTEEVQVFTAYIDVVEPRGAAVLDTQIVTILVPPDPKL